MAVMNPQNTRFAIWILFVMGTFMTILGLWKLMESIRSESWPTVNGQVLSAQIETHVGKRSTTYSPLIAYQYQVSGASYTGSRWAYGAKSSSLGDAQEIIDRFPVGSSVPVHYSPAYPAESVLETGIHDGTTLQLGGGIMLIFLGGIFMLMTRPRADSA